MTTTPEKPKPPMSGVIVPARGADIDFQIRRALQAAKLDRHDLLQWVADEKGNVVISAAREVL